VFDTLLLCVLRVTTSTATTLPVVVTIVGAERAVEAHRLPETNTLAAAAVPPIFTEVTKVVTLATVALAQLAAMMIGAEMAFDAHTFPAICKFDPKLVAVPTPTGPGPVGPFMTRVVSAVTFVVRAVDTFVLMELETVTLPATWDVEYTLAPKLNPTPKTLETALKE
jgi:hypothetical protein